MRADAASMWVDKPADVADSLIKDVLPKVQREHSQFAARRRFEHELARCSETKHANMHSHVHVCTAASAFLRAMPVPGRTMGHSSYRAAARRRLLQLCLPEGVPADECACGEPTASLDAEHPFSCAQTNALHVERRDAITQEWREALVEAGVSSTLEPLTRNISVGAGAIALNAQAAGAESLRARRAARCDSHCGDVLWSWTATCACLTWHTCTPPYTHRRAATHSRGATAAATEPHKHREQPPPWAGRVQAGAPRHRDARLPRQRGDEAAHQARAFGGGEQRRLCAALALCEAYTAALGRDRGGVQRTHRGSSNGLPCAGSRTRSHADQVHATST